MPDILHAAGHQGEQLVFEVDALGIVQAIRFDAPPSSNATCVHPTRPVPGRRSRYVLSPLERFPVAVADGFNLGAVNVPFERVGE